MKTKKYFFDRLSELVIVTCGLAVTTPASAFTLRNYQTGLCLGIAAGNPNPGTALVTWTCDGTPSQQWAQIIQGPTVDANGNYNWYAIYNVYSPNFTPPYWYNRGEDGGPYYFLSSGLATITNVNYTSYSQSLTGALSSSVIGVSGAVMNNGTPLIEWPQTNVLEISNQDWFNDLVGYDFTGHGCYVFINQNSGASDPNTWLVMGVSGGNPNRGAPVIIWQEFLNANGQPDYLKHPDQTWCVYP